MPSEQPNRWMMRASLPARSAALCLPVGIFLAGCSTSPALMVQQNMVHGYWYQDPNHPDGVSQASPQAEYNATHGTWLWPPAQNGMPD
jgi:hypothetical protein